MAVSGEKRAAFGKFKVGFFEAKVLAFSPSKDEILKIYNVSEENEDKFKEQEYTGKKDDVKFARVDVWLQDVKDEKFIQKRAFFIENKERRNKKDTLSQFINSQGQLTWSDSEENLPSWFLKNGEVRKALTGEEPLYNFLRNFLGELDFKNEDTTLSIDTKQLFLGNFDELNELIGTGYETTIVALAEVRTTEKDGEVKQYQNINENFLPGYMMKQVRLSNYTPESIEKLRAKNGQLNDEGKKVYLKGLDAYVVNLTDPEYGSKNEFVLGILEDYDTEKSFVASNEVIKHENDSAGY